MKPRPTVEQSSVLSVRRRLRRAWTPFFARFGGLTQAQAAAAPLVLEGRNVVLSSPTASGKTEAVVAPLAERLIAEGWDGLSVLYVVPTRSLANDTLVRIKGPLQDMGISCSLKHGDRPYFRSDRPPQVLITTPESLDSLLCRHSSVFSALRAAILDEIHLVDNTYRGDQLRVLLGRLAAGAKQGMPSTYLLSATLGNPLGVALRYTTSPAIVSVKERRPIESSFCRSHADVARLARQKGWRKLLCFCNMRQSVESVAAELAGLWSPYPVVAHHGSLDRSLREEAEMVMHEADAAICVATSTLEVGVDIGDIDSVVLSEVPWSLSSLLQRIGRGNRRTGISVVAAVAQDEPSRAMLDTMLDMAATGVVPESPYLADVSVAVQQAFSLLYQHPAGLSESALAGYLSPICTPEDVHRICSHLSQSGWLEWRSGQWCASTATMDMGEKGRLHSNIPDAATYAVVDVATGRRVGAVAGVFDDVFALGRRAWRVVGLEGGTVRVQLHQGRASSALFRPHKRGGAFQRYLPPELRGA